MNQLNESCFNSSLFPKNLIIPDTYDHCLKKYFIRLNENQERLFCEEADAVVDFWQLKHQASGGCRPADTVSLSVVDFRQDSNMTQRATPGK